MIIFQRLLLLTAIFGLLGCSPARILAPTPNIFANGDYPDSDISQVNRAANSSILYVTDRMSQQQGDELSFTAERSSSMALGVSTVSFGDGENWQSLKAASGAVKRDTKLPLKILKNQEILRFDPTPIPFSIVNGQPHRKPAAVASYDRKRAAFQSRIRKEMQVTGKNEVTIFVHGFNNTFEDAIFSLADIWHFSGRNSVPIAYSWPAGAGGLFGYFTDRESGEYTIFHLKEFLTQLSQIPELQKIHIVAHSRGTDVTTTALREMIIAVRNQGKDPKKVLKVANLIMAAPDLDFSVVRQRLVAEGFGAAIGQITVYMNRADTALGIAQRLMAGQRFGKLTVDDLRSAEQGIFLEVGTVHFVNVEGVKGITGHAYFRTNRNVLSDISILIQQSATPGSSARPLNNIEGNFWTMPEEYPLNRP